MENNKKDSSKERGTFCPETHKRRHIEFNRALRDSRLLQRIRLEAKYGDKWEFYRIQEDNEEMELLSEYYYN